MYFSRFLSLSSPATMSGPTSILTAYVVLPLQPGTKGILFFTPNNKQ
jgi:hypothetical protein